PDGGERHQLAAARGLRHLESPVGDDSRQGADDSRRGRSLALLVVAILIVLSGVIAGAVIVPRLPPQEPTPSHSPLRRDTPGSQSTAAPARSLPFMRGVCWEAAGRAKPSDLEPLIRIHANWISQTP